MTGNINEFMLDPADQKSNSKEDIKRKLQSIVSSMEVMDEEKANIKEILGDLKAQHEIKPAVARKVAKIMHDPESLSRMEQEQFETEELYNKIK